VNSITQQATDPKLALKAPENPRDIKIVSQYRARLPAKIVAELMASPKCL